jgi:hypothetical protein
MATIESKSDIRVKFFELLFGTTQGYLCIATSGKNSITSDFSQYFFEWPNEALKIENFILTVEENRNVYFCVNLLRNESRKKENCLPGSIVWADLDGVEPELIEEIPPPIFWASSYGRWQAIWRLTVPVPAYQAEEYSRKIGYLVGADRSGWDLTQLLRVPLTLNFKYDPPAYIELERLLETQAPPLLFDAIPPDVEHRVAIDPMPVESSELNIEMILYKFKNALDYTDFGAYFTQEPEKDWSSILWRLLHICFRVGMTAEEVFTVARHAKCNKYERDGRPPEHLWRDVLKAAEHYLSAKLSALIEMPVLVEEPYSETFIDTYRNWAKVLTDASPDFHNLCAFIAFSALVSNSVRIETSVGALVPNLWGLLIGDSTITRKTTAMRLVVEFLTGMDKELVAATDGTAEGLLQAMSVRPNKSSVYHKDEVSMLFDSMMRKDYMAGMQETLTALYDSPPYYKKRLANRDIIVESPVFIFLGGGVPDRILNTVSESFVFSGFLPRFLISTGESQGKLIKALGPPTEAGIGGRPEIFNKFADVYETYGIDVETRIGGQKVLMPPRYIAKLTPEAWAKNAEFETILIETALKSSVKDLALPTLDRLSRSILKMATILACLEQKPKNGIVTVKESNVINAAWYAQKWGENAIHLMLNAGKGTNEKTLEKIFTFIENNPGALKSVVMLRFHLDAKGAANHLQTLEERDLIRKEKRGNGWAYWTR